MKQPSEEIASKSGGYDFSTPEGQAALQHLTLMVLEIREESTKRMARRIALYERSLGLAVIPILLRRALLKVRFGKRAGTP